MVGGGKDWKPLNELKEDCAGRLVLPGASGRLGIEVDGGRSNDAGAEGRSNGGPCPLAGGFARPDGG